MDNDGGTWSANTRWTAFCALQLFGKVQACKGSYFTSDESMTWSKAKKVKSIICLKSIIDDLTTGNGSVK